MNLAAIFLEMLEGKKTPEETAAKMYEEYYGKPAPDLENKKSKEAKQ